jgi:hypothetical protein
MQVAVLMDINRVLHPINLAHHHSRFLVNLIRTDHIQVACSMLHQLHPFIIDQLLLQLALQLRHTSQLLPLQLARSLEMIWLAKHHRFRVIHLHRFLHNRHHMVLAARITDHHNQVTNLIRQHSLLGQDHTRHRLIMDPHTNHLHMVIISRHNSSSSSSSSHRNLDMRQSRNHRHLSSNSHIHLVLISNLPCLDKCNMAILRTGSRSNHHHHRRLKDGINLHHQGHGNSNHRLCQTNHTRAIIRAHSLANRHSSISIGHLVTMHKVVAIHY